MCVWGNLERHHREAKTRTGPKIHFKFAKQNGEEENMQRDKAVTGQLLGKSRVTGDAM